MSGKVRTMPSLEALGFDEDDPGNLLEGYETSYSAAYDSCAPEVSCNGVHAPVTNRPAQKKFPNKCAVVHPRRIFSYF